MEKRIDTIIIGGGQGGLSTSYYLNQRGREHVVLEQAAQAGNSWRNGRWDSFTFVTPNWTFRLPGAEYQGDSPDGFMPLNDIVASFERYVRTYSLPVQYDTKVNSIEPIFEGEGYLVKADEADWKARNVVVATGLFQQPKIPLFSRELSAQINQLHSSQYRNPRTLPEGAVLVIGSAQSGCQITEELYQSGRKVYQCLGSAGRVPRRYRGKDIVEWLNLTGFFDRTVENLPSPAARFAGNPHVSGRDGGHTLNLHQFARDGVVLLGHIIGGNNTVLQIAPDHKECLTKADNFEIEIIKQIDNYIDRAGLNSELEDLPKLTDGYQREEITQLDLRSAGVTSIIWATGYTFDFNFVRLPVLDISGFPAQKHGVTDYPGLYFMGLPWLTKMKSGLLFGVGEDAEFIAAQISSHKG
jgi:putative flavoprotein involved in K+ transport